ncbi:MAG: hypothetical protein IKW98_01510 [Prevotella sp.]|nr:hypothetical protein [Prevotella sp.]
MKKLAKWLFLFVGMIILFSCNKAQQAKPENFDEKPAVEQVEYVPARDTIAAPVEEKAAPEVSPKKGKNTPSSSSYSPRSEKSREYDNMRGFDPASEDDMDDNGMSRYMENNDDEGWD